MRALLSQMIASEFGLKFSNCPLSEAPPAYHIFPYVVTAVAPSAGSVHKKVVSYHSKELPSVNTLLEFVS
jgi:hypothetical protein